MPSNRCHTELMASWIDAYWKKQEEGGFIADVSHVAESDESDDESEFELFDR